MAHERMLARDFITQVLGPDREEYQKPRHVFISMIGALVNDEARLNGAQQEHCRRRIELVVKWGADELRQSQEAMHIATYLNSCRVL